MEARSDTRGSVRLRAVPRRLNDVFFAVHASLAGAALLAQIALYEKGSQTLSTTCKRITAALAVGLLAAMAVSLWPAVPWQPLDFFYLLGYIKARRLTTMGPGLGKQL